MEDLPEEGFSVKVGFGVEVWFGEEEVLFKVELEFKVVFAFELVFKFMLLVFVACFMEKFSDIIIKSLMQSPSMSMKDDVCGFANGM